MRCKSVSFGNGVVLDVPDYLEYFNSDPGISIIGVYMEGARDGRRFLSVLREVTLQKPVVIWKGGRTSEGARAIGSHTGSLAIPQEIWQVAVKQCGAVTVRSLEEFVDTMKALHYLPPLKGVKMGVTGVSGGEEGAR